jgi:release factor glutamine methyltransferase
MTGPQALAAAVVTLRAAGVEDPATDARRLMAHAAGVTRDRLTVVLPDQGAEVIARFQGLVAERARRVPVSHLTGTRAFWGRDFIVTPDVLDPRPDTETLVALALAEPFDRVIDLGTGSGCILLTLLAERPTATGLGLDLSVAALGVARRNADVLAVTARVAWDPSDWWRSVTGRFDLIVSNPPYIAASEMPGLAPEVRDFEPGHALTDGADGLTAYRAIAGGLAAHAAPGARILLEIGATQGAAVTGILRQAGLLQVTVHPDINGRDRVVSGRWPTDPAPN